MGIHVVRVGKHSFDLSREVPHAEQKWRSHLMLLHTGGGHLVGLVENVDTVMKGDVFTLYAAMSYISPQFQVVPGQGGAIGIRTATPPVIMPYDGIAPATVRVTLVDNHLHICKQDEKIQTYMFENYQNHFSPMKVVPAGNVIVPPGAGVPQR